MCQCVVGWYDSVPDLPVGIDSEVKVESQRFHFRWVSWEMGWMVTILQCAFYREAHFPNCGRGIQSIHFGSPAGKTIPSPCAKEGLLNAPSQTQTLSLSSCMRFYNENTSNELSSTLCLRFEHLQVSFKLRS